jgi:hypothetical protein
MKHVVLIVTGVMLLLAGSVSAHHGYASYNRTETMTIEGTLVDMQYRNPHVVLRIQTEKGVFYTATWDSALSLRHSCVDVSTLKVGDRLVVSGAPPVDITQHQLALLTAVRRPSDGWLWLKSAYSQVRC